MMALIDEVKRVCDRLAPLGWRKLLLDVTNRQLDIAAPSSEELAARLARPFGRCDVRRKSPGFTDFCATGIRAIEPGCPSRSLLYHALASPLVRPFEIAALPRPESAYPTLEELDCIENYVYAAARVRLADLMQMHGGLTVAVFAYQYRPAPHTPHGCFADVVYARTGVARTGTRPGGYDAVRRRFGGDVEECGGMAARPARYGVFLAARRRPRSTDGILHTSVSDQERTFLFPVHKLFPGSECVLDLPDTLAIAFREFHRNEKLRRVHQVGGLALGADFDLNAAPFVRDSGNSSDLVALHPVGASALLSPVPHERLVRTATQRLDDGKEEIARFVVPPATPENRSATSLRLAMIGEQVVPERIHIGHEVIADANGEATVVDLTLLPEEQLCAKLAQGGYEAAHFIDDTCDGMVTARVRGLPSSPAFRDVHPAFSLVLAPVLSSSLERQLATQWTAGREGEAAVTHCQRRCEPLSKGRCAVNTSLPRPDVVALKAFDPADDTLLAVVTVAATVPTLPQHPLRRSSDNFSDSFLPDAVPHACLPDRSPLGARAENDERLLYAACGWGSPFLEAMNTHVTHGRRQQTGKRRGATISRRGVAS